MTYEEFCTKKEIVTNNFRKNKWRTESGSFTYPRGKKTLDTLKDIIDQESMYLLLVQIQITT